MTAARPETVSVLIPCHNYGRFLEECLASVDAQDRRPDEIIISDDGSADDSWAVMTALATGRPDIRLLRHQSALGAIRTFNELVRESTGTIAVLLSADDRLGPTYLRRMEEDLHVNGWDFGYSDYELFGAEHGWFQAPEFDPVTLVRMNYISGTSAFRRSLFDRVGGFRLDFDDVGFEDYDFWLSAVERGGRGGRVPGCSFEWRRHPGGSRNTVSRRRRLELRLRLALHHPRFFLHPRTMRCVGRALAGTARPGVTDPVDA